MTGADTPCITVRQYGDAASIRSLIFRQPDNTEFLLCWKGKYIVGITNVPAEQHFNVRYEYDNSAVIAHDFFADDPYPCVLTIDASESSDPTPVADFETELRAFLGTVGVGNVALSRVARLEWWNTNAAFYEASPVIQPITVVDNSGNSVTIVNIGEPIVNSDDEECLTVVDALGTQYLVQVWGHDNLLRTDGGFTDIMPEEYWEDSHYIFTSSINTDDTAPANNWKLLKWLVDNELWQCQILELYTGDGMERNLNGNSCSAGANSAKLVSLNDSNTYGLFSDEGWTQGTTAYINCAGTGWVESVPQGILDLEFATPDVLSDSESSENQRKNAWNGLILYLYDFIKFAPA